MSGHIPGPWGCVTRRGSWDWVVYQASDPNIEICQMFHDDTEFNETGEANARLIAAAPDLLAALKAMVDRWEPDCSGQDRIMWENARDAITKAEGS